MRALSPTVAGIVLAAWAAVGVHAFVKVPYVSPVVNQSAYDVWRYNAWEFNAAPYLIPSCLNCSAAGGPTSSDVYFAHDPMDALAAAREAIGSGVAQLQVRSGKHSYTAVGATTTGAAVIDVSNLTFMGQVFQTSCPARDGTQGQEEPCTAIHVGPGLKLFNLYDGLAQQGYMFPGGTCPTVGVSGFTLGGGLGIWSRALGVAVDNVLGANVIVVNQTAPQGLSLTSVTPESDPELFRALRGAGNNNFGIVVNLTVRVDPVPNQVSRWRINYSNFTACRDKAFPLFEAGVTDSWSDTGAGPASVTVAFDIYDNGCAAIVSGFNMTAKALEDALQRRGWLAVDGASPDPSTGPDTQAWPTAVANSEGCDTVEACAKRVTTEIPDPRSPGRWQAFTSFQYAALTRGDREALFAAVHNTSTLAKGTFVVAIVDMLGGAVNVTARDLDTTFVHHTALYHVQILAYLGSDDYEASEQAWQWADGVLGALDVAAARTGRAPAGYRNYPSSRLPHANLRFYGDVTLEFLQLLRQKRDPNGVFAYNGGV